jgi:hypothetical protein
MHCCHMLPVKCTPAVILIVHNSSSFLIFLVVECCGLESLQIMSVSMCFIILKCWPSPNNIQYLKLVYGMIYCQCFIRLLKDRFISDIVIQAITFIILRQSWSLIFKRKKKTLKSNNNVSYETGLVISYFELASEISVTIKGTCWSSVSLLHTKNKWDERSMYIKCLSYHTDIKYNKCSILYYTEVGLYLFCRL